MAGTLKLFYSDPAALEAEAKILSVEDEGASPLLVLDRTTSIPREAASRAISGR
jgi:Ser-tRNA(Ala) deacylase AlaX